MNCHGCEKLVLLKRMTCVSITVSIELNKASEGLGAGILNTNIVLSSNLTYGLDIM